MSNQLEGMKQSLSNNQIDQLLKKIHKNKNTAAKITKRKDSGSKGHLSFSQKRLWFLMQLDKNNAFYNVPVTVKITGRINIELLEESINQIILRHESLRSEFYAMKGKPYQRAVPNVQITLPIIDLRYAEQMKKKAEMDSILQEEARKPFDLEKAPLIRGLFILLEDEEVILGLTMHHIISDGWSLGVFIKELGAYYEALTTGTKPVLKELPVQYLDYTAWQMDKYESGVLAKQLDFWKAKLKQNSGPLSLPLDKSRPPIQKYNGAHFISVYSKSLYDNILKISQEEQTTLYMTLLSCVYLLLFRYSNQNSINIGTPLANRQYPELEDLIGFFVNTIVMKTDISENMTFKELLNVVRNTALDSFENQDCPFEKIVEELHIVRDQSYNPLFQVMFVLQNAPMPPLKLKNQLLTYIPIDIGTSKFDITFQMTVLQEGLELDIEYNTDLFEKETIQKMVGHLQSIMEAVSGNPDLKLFEVPLLRKNELDLLKEWNSTDYDFKGSKLLTEMFSEQVQKTPDHIALCYEGKTLTYKELDCLSSQLAHYLIKKGIGPEVPVGLLLDRSLELVIAIMGTIKAGSAYVPLGTGYPADRLQFMLEDSQVPVLLTQSHLADSIPKTRAHVLFMDSQWEEVNKESRTLPVTRLQPGNMAYIIYTSGSTGKPKGVINEHQGICNRLEWMRQFSQIGEKDRVIQKTPYTFDVSVWEFFLPLISGASLYLVKPVGHTDSQYLLNFIYENKITIAHFVPSMLRIFLQEKELFKCLSLKQVYSSGETLSCDLVDEFYASLESQLFNLYGPTEAAVDVTWWKCRPGEAVVPIGHPISNIQVHILDSYKQQVPIGVPGELYIGGIGVARGYLNREELTKACFVPDPFSRTGEYKLYKTGDLAKWNSRGAVEYLGRNDFQVKVRGIRIELGEIETRIAQHPDVKDIVVVALPDASGSSRLIAYWVKDQKSQTGAAQLKEYVRKALPEYMVPSLFIALEEMPLLSNGKVDRKSLPSPDQSLMETNRIIISARNETDAQMIKIWNGLLNISCISIEDSFFELGGHSLLAIQLVSQIRDHFQVELPLRELLSSPKISALSDLVQRLQQKEKDYTAGNKLSSLGMITPDSKNLYKPFILNDVQQAYWIGRNAAYELGNTSAHLYVEIEGKNLDMERLNHSINLLIARHPMLRAIVQPNGQQVILQNVPLFQMKVTDLTQLTADEAEKTLLLIRDELSHQMFETENYPLFDIRATLKDRVTTRLHFSLDLLIGDALSWYTLINELGQLVHDFELKLQPIQLSFRDYVLAEKSILTTDEYQKSRKYWMDRIDTLPLAPQLCYAKQPREITDVRFERYGASLSEKDWKKLKEFGAAKGVTPSVILLGAFSHILAKWSKNSRFTLNLSLFNRLPLHPEVNQIIGDFTSLNLLEIDMGTASTFGGHLQVIQNQLWDDLDHRYFNGIQVLRELAKLSEDGSRALMPVVFTSTITQTKEGLDASVVHKLGNVVYGISQTPQIYFDHSIYEDNGTLFFHWDVIEEIFPAGLIQDMFNAYTSLLNRIATNLHCWDHKITDIVPLNQLQLFHKKNDTGAPVSQHLLHYGIDEMVLKKGQKPAVISSNHQLSYDELSGLSDNIADWLRENQVRPDQLVAVVMEKGWEQAVAVLGILRAQAAYLPIDPKLPMDRIAYLFKNGKVKCAITQPSVRSKVQWPEDILIAAVTKDDQGPKRESARTYGSSENLAYVIFTSGSTGKPKGVAIEHKGALNTILDVNSSFNVTDNDRLFAISSLSFDLSVYDIFGMLNAGGTIIFPDAHTSQDPAHWFEMVHKHQVTIWNSVPALMDLLVEYAINNVQKLPDSLRLVLMSGDWIPTKLPDQIRSIAHPDIQIISMGGATEASIWSIIYPVDKVAPTWKSIPYGHAMKNQKFYVLDKDLSFKPVWAPGDLYIGGIGLAREYWGDKEKTDNSFIVHPVTGERLYKTGDLGRYLPDGEIEFLGREDSQVKIRGFRIELGEIEVALKNINGVRDAIVQVKEMTNNKTLIGYVLVQKNSALTAGKIREGLLEKLPGYMVPTSLLVLENWPVTANGKVDIKALPNPKLEAVKVQINKEKRSSTLSDKILNLVRNVLMMDQIEIDTNLLKFGINSIDVVRIANLLEKEFGVRMQFQEFYREPTIDNIALSLESRIAEQQNSAAWQNTADGENVMEWEEGVL